MTEGTIEMRPTMNFRYLKTTMLYKSVEDASPREIINFTLQQQFINTATG